MVPSALLFFSESRKVAMLGDERAKRSALSIFLFFALSFPLSSFSYLSFSNVSI